MAQNSELDASAEELIRAFYQFRKLHRIENRPQFVSQRLMHDLKGSEVMLLFILADVQSDTLGGMAVSDLSRAMGVRPPSITPLLAALEEKGLLERTMDKNDRRIVRVSLCEKGRVLLQEHKQHVIEKFRGLVEYLGIEKSQTLTSLINEAFAYIRSQNEKTEGDEGRGFPNHNDRGAI